MRAANRWLWVLLLVVLGGALAVGASADATPRSNADRVTHLASRLRCPTCRSQSALESDSPAAEEIRAEIARRVQAGETDAEIQAYFADRFGQDILLAPRSSGVSGLVWALPVVVLVVATAGLGRALWRWRAGAGGPATDDDRALVARVLRREGPSEP